MKKVITTTELVEMLKDYKGATFVNVVTATEPKMRKTNNPYFGSVRKLTTQTVMLGADYEKAVNKRLEKEGKDADFTKEATYCTPIGSSNAIKQHPNGQIYLYCSFLTNNKPKSRYVFEGREIEKSLLEPFLSAKSVSVKQGLTEENEVIVRNFKIENVVEITLSGTTYTIA